MKKTINKIHKILSLLFSNSNQTYEIKVVSSIYKKNGKPCVLAQFRNKDAATELYCDEILEKYICSFSQHDVLLLSKQLNEDRNKPRYELLEIYKEDKINRFIFFDNKKLVSLCLDEKKLVNNQILESISSLEAYHIGLTLGEINAVNSFASLIESKKQPPNLYIMS